MLHLSNWLLGFGVRTNSAHRQRCDAYRRLKVPSQRAKYVKDFAVRWSELVRLPYFDLCRMVVVDPMHNLLLGTSLISESPGSEL